MAALTFDKQPSPRHKISSLLVAGTEELESYDQAIIGNFKCIVDVRICLIGKVNRRLFFGVSKNERKMMRK